MHDPDTVKSYPYTFLHLTQMLLDPTGMLLPENPDDLYIALLSMRQRPPEAHFGLLLNSLISSFLLSLMNAAHS